MYLIISIIIIIADESTCSYETLNNKKNYFPEEFDEILNGCIKKKKFLPLSYILITPEDY